MDNKETLKTYYETGDKPTQEQFEKLIYACVGTLEKTDDLPVATSAQENVIYQIGKAFYQCKVLSGIYGWQYIGSLGTDEKVKYDASDPTAGYIADKFIAGTGISLAEGTGANENKLVITSTAEGSGDMLAATYDPTNVAGDAFDMDNMVEGDTNKLVSSTEKSNWDAKLDYLPVIFSYSGETLTSTKTVAEIIAAITAEKQIIAYYIGIVGFITENITVGTDLVAFTFMDASSTIKIIGDGSGETDSWTLVEETIEKTSNKVSTWSVTPNDTNYPSEKLVKDGLDYKQDALTFGIANTNVPKIDDSSAADNDYARFTANGLEGRSAAEVLSDIGGQASLGFTPEDTANKETSALDTSTTKYPCNNVVKSAVDGKVTANSAITGATKTKVTYDAKGLVTSGEDATTSDIADSTNKRYCTDAEKTILGNTSGINTGDQESSDFDIKDLTDSTSLRSTWSEKQDALTFGIANTNTVKIDAADVSDNDYARFTANGLEGRSTTELLDDIGGLSKQLVYPLSNDSYSGFTIAGILYESASFGDAMCFDGTKWRKLSDAIANKEYRTGVCVLAGNADENTIILLYGTIRADSVYDFTIGLRLYAGATPGEIVSSDSDAVVNVYLYWQFLLGTALDANTAFICPQMKFPQKYLTGENLTVSATTASIANQDVNTITKINLTGTIESCAITISQTIESVVVYLIIENQTANTNTITFSSAKTIVKNYSSLSVAAGETLFVRYWLFKNKINIISDEIGSGTGTDEKVKFDADDPTAGYIADKFIAGTGISLAEGTGANENKLVITSTAEGSGDMLAATYDPTNVAGDAFDMDNMVEGDTNLILTSSERTKISNSLTYFTLNYYQAKPATCTTGETCFDTSDGKIYTATATDTWGSGVAASTSVLYVWQFRIYEYITGTTLSPLAKNRKLRKSPTVTSNAFSWNCSGESSKSFVSNNANTTCTVTPVSGDEDTEHSLKFTNSDASNSHTISFAAASGFTLSIAATTLTIPASGKVELSCELDGTVCDIKYSIN